MRGPTSATTLRRPGDALPRASIGTVPILWNNVDLADLRLGTDAATILDEIARTGYEGTQLGIGFPEGAALRDALAERRLRLAEVYAVDPGDGRRTDARRDRRSAASGCACSTTAAARSWSWPSTCRPVASDCAGRAGEPGTPVLTDAGWDALLETVHGLAAEAVAAGHRAAFHPHGGTFIETPAEVDRLVAGLDPDAGRHLPRRRPLPRRRRRPGRGAARARRSGHPHPPQGRRPGRPRRPAQRGARWLRCRDPGAPLHRARGGRARPRRRPRGRWPTATTTAG